MYKECKEGQKENPSEAKNNSVNTHVCTHMEKAKELEEGREEKGKGKK